MSDEERLMQLLDRWEDSWKRGSPASAEELCHECPELVEPLRRRIEDLKLVESALGHGREFDSTAPTPGGRAEFPVGTEHIRPTEFRAMGGFGEVYIAYDSEFGRTVVAKYMKNWQNADADALRRFFLEADVTANLQHPGIVPIYDKGRDDEGRPYYSMRFVDSQTLADEIEQLHAGGRVDWSSPTWLIEFRRLLQSLVAACETVAFAHAQGYVHRDIKSSNIMVGPFGETLVLDWGLAKPLDGSDEWNDVADEVRQKFAQSSNTSLDGLAKGSPAYMSPEQAAGAWKRVGPASDIYSLGATLYALLAGRPPYRGPVGQVLKQVQAGKFDSPRGLNADVPQALEAICLKAMSLEQEKRYRSAKQFSLDLGRWLADAPVTAWPEPWTVRTRRWLLQHKTWVVGISAAVLVSLAALGGLVAVQFRANENLTSINDELKAANQREREATENANRALEQLQEQFYRAQMDLASNSLFESNAARAEELLDSQWPKPGERDRRNWEWYQLWSLVHREQRVLKTGPSLIGCVAFSPKDRMLAAGRFDGRIILWNPENNEQHSLDGHTALVHDVAFFADGTRLASTGNDGKVIIWDLSTRRPTMLHGPSVANLSISISPDGNQLATGGSDGVIRLWDPLGIRETVSLPAHKKTVWGVAYLPDGTLLAGGAVDGDVTLWNPKTEELVHRFTLGNAIQTLTFDPRGAVLAVGTTGAGVQLLDPIQHQVLGAIPTGSACRAVTFSPTGSHFAVVENFGSILVNKVTPEGTNGGSYYLWHSPDMTSATFSADGKTIAAGDEDGNVVTWDLEHCEFPVTLPRNGGFVFSVASSRDHKRMASCDASDSILLRDEAGQVVHVLRSPGSRVGSVLFSPIDDILVVGCANQHLEFWDSTTGQLVASFGGPAGVGTSLAFSQDGKLLASGGLDGIVKIWDPTTKTELATIAAHDTSVAGLAFTPDGRHLISGSEDQTFKVWDVATWSLVTTLNDLAGKPSRMALTPDGQVLVTSNHDGMLYLWDWKTGEMKHSVRAHSGAVLGLAVTPDGTTILTTGADMRLKAWDALTLHQRASLPSFADVTGLVVTTDGRTLISGAMDGGLRVWKSPTDREIFEFLRKRLDEGPTTADQTEFALACWGLVQREKLRGPEAAAILSLGLDTLQQLQKDHPTDERQTWIKRFEKAISEANNPAN